MLTPTDLQAWESATDYAKLARNRTGYYNQKYYLKPAERSTQIRNNPLNIRLIRLAEVYLNYAEACVKAPTATDGEDQARTYLNLIRTRVSLGEKHSAGNQLFEDILTERRLELGMEGFRFWDMIRTGKAATVFAAKGTFSATDGLLPIPQAEIDNSGGVIKQNPMN